MVATPARGPWRYEIYGLTLESNRPLAPSKPARDAHAPHVTIDMAGGALIERPADATLRYTTDAANPDRAMNTFWEWPGDAGTHIHLRYAAGDDYADFIVSPRGDHVRASWTGGAREDCVITLLLGPVLAAVLRRRGTTCLHASAVAFDERALAITAPSGGGKSTLAAALGRRGLAILGDEIAVLAERHSSFVVHPGEARMRLWPSIAEQLRGDAAELSQVFSTMPKRWLPLETAANGGPWRHQSASLPLAAIYVMGRRSADGAIRIQPFSPAVATMVLSSQLYFGALAPPSQRGIEFARLGRLAARVPVRRLCLPHDATRIDDCAAALIADATTLQRQRRCQT